MKLTSLDIHHKEFRHSLRGYAEDEVDKFLDEVADEFERLLKENIDLSEQLQSLTARIRDFEIKESAVNNAIIAAQTAADEMRNKAGIEADTVLKDAEIKAKEIIHNALARKQQVAAELVRIKQAEEEFRARFKSILEQHQRAITEVALPDDVEVLLGDTGEGVESDVVVRSAEPTAEPAAAPVAFEPLPVFDAPDVAEPAPSLQFEPAPTPAPQPAEAPAEQTRAMPAVDQAQEHSGGYVQSVTLGEMSSPDLPVDVELVDPAEFNLPNLRSLGEREDDIDIEEID